MSVRHRIINGIWYNIRGYYDRGKIVIKHPLLVSSFNQLEVIGLRGWKGGGGHLVKFLYLSINLNIWLFYPISNLHNNISIWPFIYHSIFSLILSIHLSLYLSIHLFTTHCSLNLSIHLTIHLFIHPIIYIKAKAIDELEDYKRRVNKLGAADSEIKALQEALG